MLRERIQLVPLPLQPEDVSLLILHRRSEGGLSLHGAPAVRVILAEMERGSENSRLDVNDVVGLQQIVQV